MAKLVNLSIASPGFFGLNTQASGEVLPVGWATKATNLVIDEVGRLAKRNGTRQQTTSGISGGSDIEAAHSYIDNAGNTIKIVAADDKLWSVDGGVFTDITGTATTPTANNWKFQNFNGKVVAWQESHNPIVMLTTGGSFADITGSPPAGTEVLAAWGRLWVLDNDTLYYSDLLDETNWTTGTAGSTLLTRTWPKGIDTPVALAEFNGHLVIFGKRSTVIYTGPEDPASAFSTFAKVEGIDGTGCVERDSVVNVGRDLIFLSGKGLMSLGRVIQEKSLPETDIAPHVRDTLIAKQQGSSGGRVKAAYSQQKGLYVLVFNSATYAFDLRLKMNEGSLRVTEWDAGFRCPIVDEAGELYMGVDDHLVQYSGQLDNVLSAGSGGDSIAVDFEGVWNAFDEDYEELIKYLKRVKIYIFGGSGQTIKFKWATDYRSSFDSIQLDVATANQIARWGIAKYGIDRYSGTFSFQEISSQTSRSGRVVKVGFSAVLGDVPFAVHRIDLFAKLGKLAL